MDGTAAARLLDWDTAARVGARLAGPGPPILRRDLDGLREDFAERTEEAEAVVRQFAGLEIDGPPSRPWVMRRSDWITQNLRTFERVMEPLAKRVLEKRPDGPFVQVRRKALGFQLGALLGLLGRKVLGQYDPFAPPDDRNLIYFVGPNVVELERRYGFPVPDFRLWLCLHEITHRLQFDGVPWLLGHIAGLVRTYLDSVELDPGRLLESIRRAREDMRTEDQRHGLGVLFLLMSPEQRETFRRMQAVMSLLEGHGNYVMDALSDGRVRDGPRMRRVLHERRNSKGMGRVVQMVAGLDAKVRQYSLGERFVATAVQQAGMPGFNRVWESASNLPTLEEIQSPKTWVERVAAS
ncbi:MAG: zinc-dependent metalloprotease [Actinomycetota bacterium]